MYKRDQEGRKDRKCRWSGIWTALSRKANVKGQRENLACLLYSSLQRGWWAISSQAPHLNAFYDDDDDNDDDDDDDDDGNDVIRCKTGPQICIMVWPDGFQGVSKYDYG